MAITVLEFYIPDPPITVQWFGTTPGVTVAATQTPLPVIAAVIGPAGPQGPEGPDGPPGPQGPQGPQGETGDDAGVVYVDAIPDLTLLFNNGLV